MKSIYILIFSPLILLLSACSSHDEPPVPDPLPDPVQRSVLVYMIANNSLGSDHCDTDDLDEMLSAAADGQLGDSRLIVYHHPRNATPQLKEVTPDGINVLASYDTDIQSVTAARMAQMITDFKAIAPADRYGLILWSHGSGWIENGLEPANTNTDAAPLSFGEDAGRTMNVTTLARVLDAQGFDYIYFDCCYMAGIEVVYQLRHCADFIIASATQLPLDGMPYDRNLRHLMAPDPDLRAACTNTFNYYNVLSGSNRTCTISLIDTAPLDDLALASAEIFRSHPSLPDDFDPQCYMLGYVCYLYDFKQYIHALSPDSDLIRAWDDAFDRTVIYKAETPMLWNSIHLNNHSGLSTYITTDPSQAEYYRYADLDWWTDVASLQYIYQPLY